MTRFSSMANPHSGHAIRNRRLALFGIKEFALDEAARQIFGNDTIATCTACSGSGLANEWTDRLCETCHGLGSTYAISWGELQRRRQAVIALHPGAAIEGWEPPSAPRW